MRDNQHSQTTAVPKQPLVMPFLNYELKRNDVRFEWGFTSVLIPVIGDTVILVVRPPNRQDADGVWLHCKIVSRELCYGYFEGEGWGDSVSLVVSTEEEIPDGYIADSEEWPSAQQAERDAELKADIQRIIKGETGSV